jgi:hypothetical protein
MSVGLLVVHVPEFGRSDEASPLLAALIVNAHDMIQTWKRKQKVIKI